jgi:hypothetical protein
MATQFPRNGWFAASYDLVNVRWPARRPTPARTIAAPTAPPLLLAPVPPPAALFEDPDEASEPDPASADESSPPSVVRSPVDDPRPVVPLSTVLPCTEVCANSESGSRVPQAASRRLASRTAAARRRTMTMF